MSADYKQLVAWRKNLAALRDEAPQIMAELVIGEGVYAVKQAKSICKAEKIVNTGNYRNNFHAGDRAMIYDGTEPHDGAAPKRSGSNYRIDVYNNADYAKHLEHGFRSHFVPGYWAGRTFVYVKGYRPKDGEPGGMYVGPRGGYVKGKFVFLRAIRRTKQTQNARLSRKINKIIRVRLEGGKLHDGK